MKLIVARSYSKQIARNVNKKCCQHFLQCNIYFFRTTKKHLKSPLRFREIKLYRINNIQYLYIYYMYAQYIGHLFLFNKTPYSIWNTMFVPIDFRILGIIRIVAITLNRWLFIEICQSLKIAESSYDREQRWIWWRRTGHIIRRVWSWRSKSSGYTPRAWELVPYLHRANFHPPTVKH